VSGLSEHDASALLDFVSELQELDDPMPFPARLLIRLEELIAADWVVYSELDPVRRCGIHMTGNDLDADDERDWDSDSSLSEDLWWQLRDTHPVCGHRSATGDWTTVYKASDFVTLREFRRTPIYDTFYRGLYDHWLDFGLAPEPTRTRVFLFTRYKRPDFNERDRLVARLLQPHLAKRAEAAEAALRGAEALAAIEEGTSDEARRVVLCSGTGVIEFASASSRALLERYLGLDHGRIPAAILGRRELRLRGADRRLDVRIARTGSLHVLMLDERDNRIEKLSVRERQVLEQVVGGKGNEAVALELGIAPATVAKHLEHAYRKLGVQNRTAAAALLDYH
jgi:DNA-binding CsgD family transcriptional regulator